MLSRLFSGLCGLAFLLTAAGANADAQRLTLDRAHSQVEFVAFTHLYEVKGTFEDFEIHVDGSLDEPTKALVKVRVHASSVSTHYDEQDSSLRSKDFLDSYKHPWIEFVSTKITEKSGVLTLHGDLTIRGKSKPCHVVLRVSKGTDLQGRPTNSYRGGVTVKRSDFGVGGGKMLAELALQDEIELRLMIVVPRQAPAK